MCSTPNAASSTTPAIMPAAVSVRRRPVSAGSTAPKGSNPSVAASAASRSEGPRSSSTSPCSSGTSVSRVWRA